MEIVEFKDCLYIKHNEELPGRFHISLNGIMYVLDEWRVSYDGKRHHHLLITEDEWKRKYGN